jgi:hypothetical protein
MLKLIELIETLATASPPMEVTTHDGWVTLRQDVEDAIRPSQLDLAEDPIDAVLCAYIAMMFAYHQDDIAIYGDFPANGYIATPKLPPDLKPAASVTLAGLSGPCRCIHRQATQRLQQVGIETVSINLGRQGPREHCASILVHRSFRSITPLLKSRPRLSKRGVQRGL